MNDKVGIPKEQFEKLLPLALRLSIGEPAHETRPEINKASIRFDMSVAAIIERFEKEYKKYPSK